MTPPTIDYQAAESVLTKADARFASLIKRYGYPDFSYDTDIFGALCQGIIHQQLSGKAAATILSRFEALCSMRPYDPMEVMQLSPLTLRSVGVSRAKAVAILDVAEKFATGFIPTDLHTRPDSEVIRILTVCKGVGVWTAEMCLMFSLCRADVLPVSDLGVRKGMQRFFSLSELPKPSQMQALAAAWQPYRSVGSWYMWQILDDPQP